MADVLWSPTLIPIELDLLVFKDGKKTGKLFKRGKKMGETTFFSNTSPTDPKCPAKSTSSSSDRSAYNLVDGARKMGSQALGAAVCSSFKWWSNSWDEELARTLDSGCASERNSQRQSEDIKKNVTAMLNEEEEKDAEKERDMKSICDRINKMIEMNNMNAANAPLGRECNQIFSLSQATTVQQKAKKLKGICDKLRDLHLGQKQEGAVWQVNDVMADYLRGDCNRYADTYIILTSDESKKDQWVARLKQVEYAMQVADNKYNTCKDKNIQNIQDQEWWNQQLLRFGQVGVYEVSPLVYAFIMAFAPPGVTAVANKVTSVVDVPKLIENILDTIIGCLDAKVYYLANKKTEAQSDANLGNVLFYKLATFLVLDIGKLLTERIIKGERGPV